MNNQEIQALNGLQELELKQELAFHGDRTGRSLPTGHISAGDFLRSVDEKRTRNNWNDEQSIRFFRTCLKDNAHKWYKHELPSSLDVTRPAATFKELRTAFIAEYNINDVSTGVNWQLLSKQRPNEHVADYITRVVTMIDQDQRYGISHNRGKAYFIKEKTPKFMEWYASQPNDVAKQNANRIYDDCYQDGINAASNMLFQHNSCNTIAAGLSNQYLRVIARNFITDDKEVYTHTLKAKLIQAENNSSSSTQLSYSETSDINAISELLEEDCNIEAASRGRRPPFKRRTNTNKTIVCHFCSRTGHIESECRTKEIAKNRATNFSSNFRPNRGGPQRGRATSRRNYRRPYQSSTYPSPQAQEISIPKPIPGNEQGRW